MLYPGGRSHEKDVIERITPEKPKEKSPVSDDLQKIDLISKPRPFLDQPYDKSGDLLHGMGDISDTGLIREPQPPHLKLPEQYKGEPWNDEAPQAEPGMD